MNQRTLEKLKKNPHYKIGAQNYRDLRDDDREPMVAFGKVPSNQTDIEKHPTQIRRIPRTSK